jgi:plasmid stability protein
MDTAKEERAGRAKCVCARFHHLLSLHALIASGCDMASLTIRNLDEELKARLRVEAALHGNSMEEEVRSILRKTLMHMPAPRGLGSRIAQRFGAVGGVELELPVRNEPPRAPDF